MKLEYFGKVLEDGKLRLWNKGLFLEEVANLKGKNITLVVKESHKDRSKRQLRYYWGVIVPIVQQGFKDLGDHITKKQVHELLKHEFLFEEHIAKGKVYKVPMSLGDLGEVSIKRFNEFKEQVQQWASENLNVYIPDPNEQLAIFEESEEKFFKKQFLDTVDEQCGCQAEEDET